MHKLKNKVRLFTYHLRHEVFTRDHSFLLVVAGACLIFVISSISAMSRNWELEQRLTRAKVELALLKLEVETIELENKYYHSEEYQELSARQHLNKKLEGETLIYLPPNSAEAKNKHNDIVARGAETPSNLSQWLKFLFGI